jgi:hypothetical protein
VKLREGDVFELSLPDGRLGYGVIVKRGVLPSGGTPYMAIFRSAYDHRPDLAEIAKDEVALAGWTMDGLVYHGRWKVIGADFPIPSIPFPNSKVEIDRKFYVVDVEGEVIGLATPHELDLLDYQFSRAPISFQDAFEALHGFGEWQDHFDKLTPAYARARITRPKP